MALTGYLVNSFCAPNSQSALLAFASNFPVFINTSQNPYYANFINGAHVSGNTFTVELRLEQLTTTTNYSLTHTLILPSCDPDIYPLGGNSFDPVVAGSFFSFALTSVFFVYLLSRNAQAIIDAIKKF